MADIKASKVIASLFGNNLNAPLIPEYAFKSAQQSFRFILEVSGLNIAFITDVTRPAVSVDHKEYDYLGYSVKFPNKLKWEPISFTVIESFDERILGSVLGNLLQKTQSTAYTYPTNIVSTNFKNLSKKNLINDFGNINIRTLDPEGSVVDTWRIYNPMIKKISPSQLQYASDALTNIKIDLEYDWAEYYISSDIRPQKIVSSLLG